MKIALIFILFLLFPVNQTFGQTKPATSIANSQQAKTADSLYNLADKYLSDNNYQQALLISERSLEIFEVIGYQRKMGDC